jgi:hypothetical protein
MPTITRDHAERIRDKLSETPEDHESLTVERKKGRRHDIYTFSYRGQSIGRFGIRHGSNRNEGHNFVPRQLHLSQREGYDFAQCDISLDEYIDLLQEQGHIPQDN